MKKVIFLFLVTIVFTFCKNKKKESSKTPVTPETKVVEPTADQMTFVLDSVVMESKSCKEVGSECATISIKYLKSTGGLAIARNNLNAKFLEIIGNTVEYPGTTPKNKNSVELIAQSYIVDYDRTVAKETEKNILNPFSNETEFKVLYDSPKMVCISVSNYSYMGGAHGNYFTTLYNFNKENGELIKAKEILKDKEKLSPLLVKEVMRYHELEAGTDLKDFGFMFEGDDFPVNDNVGILKDSLLFIYNPYEVGPYVLGDLYLKIAKNEIKDQLILK